jgi:hypothetical protein
VLDIEIAFTREGRAGRRIIRMTAAAEERAGSEFEPRLNERSAADGADAYAADTNAIGGGSGRRRTFRGA